MIVFAWDQCAAAAMVGAAVTVTRVSDAGVVAGGVTDSLGGFETTLPPGDYAVIVSKDDYSVTGFWTEHGSCGWTWHAVLTPLPPPLTFAVGGCHTLPPGATDALAGLVAVAVAGSESLSGTHGPNGTILFTTARPGTEYTVTFTADGFDPRSVVVATSSDPCATSNYGGAVTLVPSSGRTCCYSQDGYSQRSRPFLRCVGPTGDWFPLENGGCAGAGALVFDDPSAPVVVTANNIGADATGRPRVFIGSDTLYTEGTVVSVDPYMITFGDTGVTVIEPAE